LQLESTKLGQEVGVRHRRGRAQRRAATESRAARPRAGAHSAILNQLRLKAAVGKLAEADLADINALLKDGAR